MSDTDLETNIIKDISNTDILDTDKFFMNFKDKNNIE